MNIKNGWFRLALVGLLSLLTLAACDNTTATAVPTIGEAVQAALVATTSSVQEETAPDAPALASGETAEESVSLPGVGGDEDIMRVDEDGNTTVDDAALEVAVNQIPAGELSESEVNGLLYMREEEKLARDVYFMLYEQWGLAIFDNIANAEQTHMDAVKTLLERYGLNDLAEGQGVGEFTNPDLQGLYDQLVAQGNQSLIDALMVGVAIEEIDILDLEQYIEQTNKADIELVYENLIAGSENHLRAFVSVLERNGQDYQPQYLDQEAYDEIINSPGVGGK